MIFVLNVSFCSPSSLSLDLLLDLFSFEGRSRYVPGLFADFCSTSEVLSLALSCKLINIGTVDE